MIVWLDHDGDAVEIEIKSAQGTFTVRLGDIPYGKMKHALNGRAMVDRIPSVSRLTTSPDEQDYPAAAAGKDGSIWLAYVQFAHHPEHNRLRANFSKTPEKFDELKSPPGGDQLFARRYAAGAWGEPIAITPSGGDLYRPAVAVDGGGRAWVFWSSNQNGNFDLWTRPIENGKPGGPVRLTTESGSDIDPAAATDSRGRIWVAWQGWRSGRAAIFTAMQNGSGFGKPSAVSASAANEWNPAIAASGDGRLTVVWDSYRHGNYDVFRRTHGSSGWGPEEPVAATAAYEAYPSIAYDPQGRLWVAYEEGGERWGKDFGAYDTAGIALYQGRAIRLRGFDKSSTAIEPTHDPGAVLSGIPAERVDSTARQNEPADWMKPRPKQVRQKNRYTANFVAPHNTMPRLHVDASGRLWLAYRSMHPMWWNVIGTVWTEHVISYDGNQWTGPIFLSHTDNLLDNRPALVSSSGGRLMVLGSSDSRRHMYLAEGGVPTGGLPLPVVDPFQNDIYANHIVLPPPDKPAGTKTAAKPTVAGIDALEKAELATVAAMRNARIKTPAGELHVVRGEFHRHSEISGDGVHDGSILDQWRYMLDAAYMDWGGCCDHDNGGGREYYWWISQKLTDIFYTPGKFVPMFSYERSVPYPEGHRNVVFAQRGIRTLPRLPPRMNPESTGRAPDTQMLYKYLRAFNGIVAMHTSGTGMGTDWRDNDALTEPVVEIYQGQRQNYEIPGAPRTNLENDSIGGWRPKGFVNLALEMGYKLAFQASSDHVSTHMSYGNVLAKDLTRKSVLEAFQKRHVYGATDNILADFRAGEHIMGDAFTAASPPEFRIKLVGSGPLAKVHIIKDNQYVYSAAPRKATIEFAWRDSRAERGKTSYYYVRGEQEDGEVVWVSPIWVTYR